MSKDLLERLGGDFCAKNSLCGRANYLSKSRKWILRFEMQSEGLQRISSCDWKYD